MQEDMHICISSCKGCKTNPPLPYATLFQVQVNSKWGQHIVNYLQNKKFPKTMNKWRQKVIDIEAMDFTIINTQLYKRGKDHQWPLCANEKECLPILAYAHLSIVGGHFSIETMAKAILMLGIWWPTLFQDATIYVQACDKCQRSKKSIKIDNMPLYPLMGARAFAKWGIDFVGPIDPLS